MDVNWFRRFMMGRYGVDQLSFGMLLLSMVLMMFTRGRLWPLALLGLAVLAHRPWLVGAASLLGLAGQLWLHNRCMIYIEAHAYGPENER